MASLYKLRCNLLGHSTDVRCVASYSDNVIVTGSRDRTVKVWKPVDEYSTGFAETLCFRSHTNFVCCACVIPPSDVYPSGLILTGSNDKTIYAFTPENPEPVYKLTGHENTVCSIVSGKFGTVLSGSWDCTARVWLNQKCLFTLSGHSATVWSVGIVTSQGIMLTGSADKTIRSWKAGHCERIFTGHEDCVRALAVLSDDHFLSASNDCTVRKWHLQSAACVAIYHGHENIIYSIGVLSNRVDFVTSSEDRTIRVWKGQAAECQQVIRCPAQTVWAVTVMSNDDIVAGTSDGIARVFTCSSERCASPDELKAYEDELSKSCLTSGEIGNIKVTDLPGREALYEPGKKDGQTKMVRDGGQVSVHQWSTADGGRWIKIGDVVGSAEGKHEPGNKVQYEGKEYDYVFSVELEQGRPALKLPYNATEDPWMAAHKFLERNNLDPMFLDQVANFIIKNTEGMTVTATTTNSYADPFTGGSRYVPGSQDPGTSHTSGSTDPFTGAGRYIPSGSTTNSYFPHKNILLFDAANIAAIRCKLIEICKIHLGTVSELVIDDIIQLCDANAQWTDDRVSILEKLLQLPKDVLFPVLDIVRLAVRHPSANTFLSSIGSGRGDEFLNLIMSHISSAESPAANRMLCLRALCNLMAHEGGIALVLRNANNILHGCLAALPLENKNSQIAFATLFLNFSVLLVRLLGSKGNSSDQETRVQCISAITSHWNMFTEPEAKFRLLISIGTLLATDQDCLDIARSLDFLPEVKRLNSSEQPKKVAECAAQLATLLQS